MTSHSPGKCLIGGKTKQHGYIRARLAVWYQMNSDVLLITNASASFFNWRNSVECQVGFLCPPIRTTYRFPVKDYLTFYNRLYDEKYDNIIITTTVLLTQNELVLVKRKIHSLRYGTFETTQSEFPSDTSNRLLCDKLLKVSANSCSNSNYGTYKMIR